MVLGKKEVLPNAQSDEIMGIPDAQRGFALTVTTPFVAPFWSVQKTEAKKEANLVLKNYAPADSKSVKFPYYINTKPIEEGDWLLALKPAPAGAPRSGPPSKKPRAK